MTASDKDRTQLEREHSRKPGANPGNHSEDREPHPEDFDDVKPVKGGEDIR